MSYRKLQQTFDNLELIFFSLSENNFHLGGLFNFLTQRRNED